MEVYSVSEMTRYIKCLMESDGVLRSVFVRGELSNFKRHYSGHWYFTLKDAGAQMKCVMFRSRAQFVKFVPKDGMKIVVGGNITVFERDGQYQLYAERLLPEGTGELQLAYEQLKARLEQEGLFDVSHKKILPAFVQKIGIVTSATGAVLRDIYTVAKRRNRQVSLCLYPVQVQGAEAPREIAHAIEMFNRAYPVDVLIVGRGGGSIEDLWAFNDEQVVRAVYNSAIPVVSAVGHETDYTLTDFASDLRAATPSQAAELVVFDRAEAVRHIRSLKGELFLRARHLLEEKQNRYAVCANHRVFREPEILLNQKRELLDRQIQRFFQSAELHFSNQKNRLQSALDKLHLLNPLGVLKRGYALVKKENQLVTAAVKLKDGDVIEVVFADGSVKARIENSGGDSEQKEG